MQTITMTELRIKPKELLQTLREGSSVDLIHRSKPVATIKPVSTSRKRFNAKKTAKIVDKLHLKQFTDKQIDNIYKEHVMKKYGQGLS